MSFDANSSPVNNDDDDNTETTLIVNNTMTLHVPKKILLKAEYFAAKFRFAEQQGHPVPTTLNVEPPVTSSFYHCIEHLRGEKIHPHYFMGKGLIDILRNADYLQMEDLLDQCHERFADYWKNVIECEDFHHPKVGEVYLDKLLGSLRSVSTADKASIIRRWALGYPLHGLMVISLKHLKPDENWSLRNVTDLNDASLAVYMPAKYVLETALKERDDLLRLQKCRKCGLSLPSAVFERNNRSCYGVQPHDTATRSYLWKLGFESEKHNWLDDMQVHEAEK